MTTLKASDLTPPDEPITKEMIDAAIERGKQVPFEQRHIDITTIERAKYLSGELKIQEAMWYEYPCPDGYIYLLQPYAKVEDYAAYTGYHRDDEDAFGLEWTEDKLGFKSYDEMIDFCKKTNCRLYSSKEDSLEFTLDMYRDAMRELIRYFTSGNSIPVPQATIRAEDFWKIIENIYDEKLVYHKTAPEYQNRMKDEA